VNCIEVLVTEEPGTLLVKVGCCTEAKLAVVKVEFLALTTAGEVVVSPMITTFSVLPK